MDEEREKKSGCEREKYSSLHMKKINQVFDGGQKNPRLHECGDHSELSNIATPGSSLSLFTTPTTLTSTGDDECGMLMAEGMAAQIKRLGLQTKAQSYNYIDFLIGRIKELEEGLANRNMVVNALKRELDMVKDTSVVDASAGPLASASFSPDSGNTVHRLSPVRDEDDDSLRVKLMQKEAEVTMLQDQLRIINRTKSEAQNEKLSNQIIVLESEVKEQADTIDELNLEVVQKTKLLCRVQDQLQKKSEDFGKQNMKTSLEIKQLMKNVEELGREVRNKDSELKQAKEELTNLRSEMQRNFILQLAHIKEQLMICHDEEKDELNSIHDDVLKQFMQSHETEVSCYKKQIEALNNRIIEHSKTERELEAELEACRLAYEAQINSYKECVENLMEELSAEKEKNEVQYKKQIEKYKNDLKKCKNEIEMCNQQIKNFDNKVAEEVRHVEEKYVEQCEQFRLKCEAQIVMYKSCAENLRQKEQMTSEEAIAVELKLNKNIDDLTKELQLSKDEIDSINVQLRESQKNEKETEELLQKCKVELENYVERCNSLNETCSTLQDTCKTLNDNYNSLTEKCNSLKEKCASFSEVCNTLNERCSSLNEQLLEKDSNEVAVSAKLEKYQSMINEYQVKLKECEEKFNSEIAAVEEKREEEVDSLQSQVNHLISTLDEVKSSHEREIGQAVEQMMRQNEQLESLRLIADCDSVEGVVQKLTENKTKTIEIEALNDKLKCATNSLCNYETRLTELRKCYEDDVCLYKNQIEKLKDELQNASSLEESVVRQLNNHMSGVKESKEQIKDILLRKDIQVYLLDNNPSCNNFTDTSSSTRVVSNNTNKGFSEINELSEDDLKLLYIKLDDLNTENNLLKQELDSLKKPKCNVSIKPHGNVMQKRHIEQALFDELEKELHDCKIDNESKLQDIEELIKENNDLADHYNKLEAQFRELKEFTAQKLDEMQLLQNEKENLFQDRMQLENNQMMLIAKLESLTEVVDKKPNSPRTLPEDDDDEEEEEEADLNMQSGGHLNEKGIKKLFKHAATSTPNFDENASDEIERDLVTPKRKIMDSSINSNQLLSKWVTTCSELENENSHLKKEIDRLNFKIKEMECCSETIKAEISAFDKNCEALKDRIFELESKKIALRELEHVNEQLKLRNEKLEEDRHILRSEVANLKEENLNLERKHGETVANLLSQKIGDKGSGNEAYENLVLELNKKSEEVLILKEELCVKQETNTSIQDELHQLLQIRNEMSTKLQLVTDDLKVAEAEITKLRQERLNLGLEKKLADKKLNVLKMQNEQLLKHFNEKLERDSDSNGVINIVEELEKELIELHKNLSEERGVIERMAVEKNTNKSCGNGSEDSGTSYKIELLLNAFEQLQYEKEGLKKKTIELQDIINKYVDNNEIDESWKLEVKESQKRLISELETYGKQRADLGKNLLESEDLRLKVELAERELLLKIEEKTKIESLLAEERQGLCNALNRISFLEKQLCEKMHVLQVMGEEKVDLQGNLWALQEKLCGLEDHLQQQKLILEGEIQERELRVRHAQLELHAAQLDKNALINKMLLEAEAETEMERVSYLREELEKEHNLAITRLKRLYSSQLHDVIEQASAQQQNVEQRHHNQLISLQEEIQQMTVQLQDIRNNKLTDMFSVQEVKVDEIIKSKEKQYEELKSLECSLNDEELKIFNKVKSNFEYYFELHVRNVTDSLKKQYKFELETAIDHLKAEHKQEIAVIESSVKHNAVKEESTIYKALETTYTNEINCLKSLLNDTPTALNVTNKKKSRVLLERLVRKIVGEYSVTLLTMMNAWQNKYNENLTQINDELQKSIVIKADNEEDVVSFDLSKLESSACDSSKIDDVNKFLILKDDILNCAEALQSAMKDNYKTTIEDIKTTIQEAHGKVVNTVSELQVQLNEGKLIASLQSKISCMQAERDQLEEEHKSAIALLLKDHDVHLSDVKSLLNEFQPRCTQHCTNSDALLSKQKLELEAKHKKELEELTEYYIQKLTEAEKNYSEEIYSHHSRKLSLSSSCSEGELISDNHTPVVPDNASLSNFVAKDAIEHSDGEVQTDFLDFLSDSNIDFNNDQYFLYPNSPSDQQEIKALKLTITLHENEIKQLKNQLKDTLKFSIESEQNITGCKTETTVKDSKNKEVSSSALNEDKIDALKKELNEKDLHFKGIVNEYESKLKLLKEQYEAVFENLRSNIKVSSNDEVKEIIEKDNDFCSSKCNEICELQAKDLKEKIVDFENINVIDVKKLNNCQSEFCLKDSEVQKCPSKEEMYHKSLDELQKQLNATSHNQQVEETVKRIVDDVKLTYSSEYERNKFEFLQKLNDKHKIEIKNIKDNLIKHYKNVISDEQIKHKTEMEQLKAKHQQDLNELKENFNAEIENLKSQMKRQELDHIWGVTVELEERYRNQMNESNQAWEERLTDNMASSAADFAIQKVTLESTLREIIKKELEIENRNMIEKVKQLERDRAQTELVTQQCIMDQKCCELETLLRKQMDEKQVDFLEQQEKIMEEFTNNHEEMLRKIRLQHEHQILDLKKLHAEELEKVYFEVKKTNNKDSSIQCDQEVLVNRARNEILSALEEQIKILVAEGDDGDAKVDWPPELAALERQFTAKYQKKLASLVQDHAVEMLELKTEYETKLQLLAESCTCGGAKEGIEDAHYAMTEDGVLNKLIKERDSLRKLTATLRGVVCELAKYLTTCEDELNNTLVNELVKFENNDRSQVSIVDITEQDSESEFEEVDSDKNCSSLLTPKRVHFAPDVSNILNEDSLLDCLDRNHDLSVEIKSELQSCLERLKLEAAAVLGLSTVRNNDASTKTVERRRLASVTRQLIEKNKINDDLNRKLEGSLECNRILKQDLADIQAELAAERACQEKERTEAAARAETVFDEKDPVIGMETRIQNLSHLQEKAKSLIENTKTPDLPAQLLTMVEEIIKEGDLIIEEARQEREDLQKQVDAADKQLRSTREFLDEQAAERESERDEYSRELEHLREQLRDKDRDWTTRERFATEWSALEKGLEEQARGNAKRVEALEQQVMETTNLLKETEEKKDEVEKELKDAIDKVWMLREVIRDLESQVSCKSEHQANLEKQLDSLESELEAQNVAQNALALELEAMREVNSDVQANSLRQLEEQFKKQCGSSVLRQIKSQVRDMSKSLQKRTKDLEALNVHISSASLSSPSEDISIREQLDMFRCGSATPEGCQSPVALPVEDISHLQEQMQRHARAEELAVKRIRDQEMQLSYLRTQYEDVLAEREVLQEKCDKQLSQLASTQTRLDEVRRRAEWEQTKTDAVLMEKITRLEEDLVAVRKQLKQKEIDIAHSKQQISYMEKQIATKDTELRAYADTQNKQIDLLQHELSVMETEKRKLLVMVEKWKEGQSISIPALMDEILADKNADIDQLEQRVKELQASQNNNSFIENGVSQTHTSHSNSKGYRVSFADEIESPDLHNSDRTRDAEYDANISAHFQPFLNTNVIKDNSQKSTSKLIRPSDIIFTDLAEDLKGAAGDFSPKWSAPFTEDNRVIEELQIANELLKHELEEKTNSLEQYEERLKEIPALEDALKRTRDELSEAVASVGEDKNFYEEQLQIISQFQQKINDKESEVQGLKDELVNKEENIIRVTADLKALQLVLDKLQKKIRSMKESAKINSEMTQHTELEQIRQENIQLSEEKLNLQEELDKINTGELLLLKQNLEQERKINENLKLELQNNEKDKHDSLSQLDTLKKNCESTKLELNFALSQLKSSETEINSLKSELNGIKNELENVTAKAKSDMENHLKKDSEDIMKLKDELEQLRSINSELESDCDRLRKEIINIKKTKDFETKLSSNESKISELEHNISALKLENKNLLEDKIKAEHKIEVERDRYTSLNAAVEAYKTSEKVAQDTAAKEKNSRLNFEKKSQFLRKEYDKLKRSKKELEKKNTVLKDELEKEKKHTLALEQGTLKVRKSTDSLTSTPVDCFEIKPIDHRLTGSLDDLAGQVQKELDASAQLDNSLLSTLDNKQTETTPSLPNEYLSQILQKILQQGFQSITSEEATKLYSEISSRIDVRSPGLSNMMERLSQLSTVIQNQKDTIENLKEQLTSEKLNYSKERENVIALQTEGERLQKIISYQEERLTSLSVTVEENRKRTSDLEIGVLKERGNFKKLQVMLENEREKVKQIQREDTELIQDLRMCLEEAKDSEVRLQICLEQERDRLQTLEAQLNAARVVEQYFSQTSTEPSHVTKCLDDLKSKCTELGVELEREKRNVESLSVSLNKEKTLSGQLRTKLHSAHSENSQLQTQIEDLKHKITEEQKKKYETEEKLKTIQEAEIRRQRSRAAIEEKHRKALDRAKSQKNDLELEVVRLRNQLIEAQSKNEEPAIVTGAGDGCTSTLPLFLQIKEVNAEIEKLVKEKEELMRTVASLMESNKELQEQLSLISSNNKFQNNDVQYLKALYMRSKSHRKALIWQKRYLMLSLQGYQESEQKLIMRVSDRMQNSSWMSSNLTRKKFSFKLIAMAVVVIIRMKTIVKIRKRSLGANYKVPSPKREHLLQHQRLRSASPKIVSGPSSLSPPIRDIKSPMRSEREQHASSSSHLLQPTRLADYLETFNELQSRLSQALGSPQKDLSIDRTIIPRVIN